MNWLYPKNWKPIFIEDSRIPGWLSKVAPLNIGAITIFFLVFSRGKINETTKRHETIHFQQFFELAFVGFPILYYGFWLLNLLKGDDRESAYYNIPFEKEAYYNDADENYLSKRKRFSWIHYIS